MKYLKTMENVSVHSCELTTQVVFDVLLIHKWCFTCNNFAFKGKMKLSILY